MYQIDTEASKIMINSGIDDFNVGDARHGEQIMSQTVIMNTYDINPFFNLERDRQATVKHSATKA